MLCQNCFRSIDSESAFCPFCGDPVPGAVQQTDYVYEAFISYRHLPDDHEIACKLQKALERFSIPRALRAPTGEKKFKKIFRDKDEMHSSDSLSEQIKAALRKSRFFILICSVDTPSSKWIPMEVEYFASCHGRNKILTVLISGEPEESFQKILKDIFPDEPYVVDLRPETKQKIRIEKFRLIAAMIGCSFDDLCQRQKTRQRKIVLVSATVLAAISLAFGSFSWYQHNQIQKNYRAMQINQSEYLATESNDLFKTGDRMQAVQVALAALPKSSSSNDRPFTPTAQLALEQAIEAYPTGSVWRSNYSRTEDGSIRDLTLNTREGLYALLNSNSHINVYDQASGTIVCSINPFDGGDTIRPALKMIQSFAFCNDKIVCFYFGDYKTIACFDARTGLRLWSNDKVTYDSIEVSPSGETIVAVDGDHFDRPARCALLSTTDGSEILESPFKESGISDILNQTKISFSEDGTRIALSNGNRVFITDDTMKNWVQISADCTNLNSLRFVDEVLLIASYDERPSRTCKFQAFDDQGNQYWSYEGNTSSYISQSADIISNKPLLLDSMRNSDGTKSILATIGRHVFVFDHKSGEITYSCEHESPIIAGTFLNKSKDPRIGTVCVNGKIAIRTPQLNQETDGNFYDVNTGTSPNSALFAELNDEISLFIAKDRHIKSYQYERLTNLPNYKAIPSLPPNYHYTQNCDHSLVASIDLNKQPSDIIILDGSSFETLRRISLADIPEFETSSYRVAKFSSTNPNRLYVFCQSDGNYTSTTLCAFDIAYGDLIAKVSLSDLGLSLVDLNRSGDYLTISERETLLFCSDTSTEGSGIIEIDANTLETISTIHSKGKARLHYAWPIGNAILVVQDELTTFNSKENTPARTCLLDAKTGADIVTFDGATPQSTTDTSCLATSSDAKLLALLCDDGMLRMFNLPSGQLLWESPVKTSGTHYLSFVNENSRILLQEDGGLCSLIDTTTGNRLKTTATTIDPIASGYPSGDNEVFYAFVGKPLRFPTLVTLSLKVEAFGPQSAISYAVALSSDASLVLAMNNKAVFTLPYYKLDDLIADAKALIVGHEINDFEKLLYHIEELPTIAN